MTAEGVALATQPTGTVGFERKVKLATGPDIYGSDEVAASIYVPFPVDFADEHGTEDAARTAFLQGKAIVFNELGLEYKLDESGVVVEMLKQHFPDSTVTSTPPAARTEQQAPRNAPSSGGNGSMRIKGLAPDGAPTPTFLPNSCPKCSGTEVWDNRKYLPTYGGDGNAKSPHFKCANKDCGNGFWPPK